MADQFDEKAAEIVDAALTWEIVRAYTDPKYVDDQAIREVLGFARKATRKALTVAFRSVNITAEARGFARGVGETSALTATLINVLHDNQTGTAELLYHDLLLPQLALLPKKQEPKADTRTDVEIEQRMDELFTED